MYTRVYSMFLRVTNMSLNKIIYKVCKNRVYIDKTNSDRLRIENNKIISS